MYWDSSVQKASEIQQLKTNKLKNLAPFEIFAYVFIVYVGVHTHTQTCSCAHNTMHDRSVEVRGESVGIGCQAQPTERHVVPNLAI